MRRGIVTLLQLWWFFPQEALSYLPVSPAQSESLFQHTALLCIWHYTALHTDNFPLAFLTCPLLSSCLQRMGLRKGRG